MTTSQVLVLNSFDPLYIYSADEDRVLQRKFDNFESSINKTENKELKMQQEEAKLNAPLIWQQI